ncbi:hypothetical protein PIB30_047204 [Stylosanthes scabra]|uniref:Transmembrane protein n=1 Tax=Stylosanthes scabra TaxID=79078 RepID=A0ABU6TGE4_9FABA|nr:hypothetical protein [Stylosanthes scabra]
MSMSRLKTGEPARNRAVRSNRNPTAQPPSLSICLHLSLSLSTNPSPVHSSFNHPSPFVSWPAISSIISQVRFSPTPPRKSLRNHRHQRRSTTHIHHCSCLLRHCESHRVAATVIVVTPFAVFIILIVMNNNTDQAVDAGENLPPSGNPAASNDTPNAVDSNESQSQATSNPRGKTDLA